MRQAVKTGNARNMKAMLSVILVFLMGILSLNAQEIRFEATASKTKAAEGEQIKITYSINANASGFTAPNLGDFNVLMGPQQMMSTQIINGRMTQSLSFSFIITGKRTGKFSIGPAKVRVGNGEIKSNNLEIEITKGTTSNPGKAASPAQANKGNAPNGGGEELFVKAIVTKTNTWVGDQILVTYKLFSRYPQLNYELLKMPTFNGFYSEDIQIAKGANGVRETFDGKEYLTAEIKKVLLFPQKSGRLEIPSMELSCLVRQRTNSGNIWDQFFGGGYRDVELKIKSAPVAVDVKNPDLAGKPANFNGAVGNLDFAVKLDRDQLRSGDAATLSISVSGKGNLKLMEPPLLELPSELEVYDPQIKDEISVSSAGMTGTRNFEYLIIPRAGGDYSLGPFGFSWFNPDKKTYETITIPALTLKVAKGSGDPVAGSRKAGATPKQLSDDIRYIRVAVPGFSAQEFDLFFLSTGFYLCLALPLLGFLVFLLWRRRQLERAGNAAFYRTREAGSQAGKRLRHAQELMQAKQTDAFYVEVYRALYGYLSDKLRIPVAQLTQARVKELLAARSVDDAHIERLMLTLNRCEFARFAPGAADDLTAMYEEASTIIQNIENQLKA